ncbi:MAG: calcium/sodium antiporter [Dehalococcoidia bacterium]
MTFLLLAVGLVLLVAGAEILVRGASRLAVGIGISPVIVGLTIVAFGTSSPELAVSLQAAFGGDTDLTVGNVVGSNIFNVLLILGVSAVIIPLTVAQRLIRIDVPIMVGTAVLLLVFSLNNQLDRWEGVILALGLAAYIGFAVYETRRDRHKTDPEFVDQEYEAEFGTGDTGGAKVVRDLAMIVGGLGLLLLGSRLLVDSATDIAVDLGLSDLIIGLTIVAAGTSLPEVATSTVAALKGERDIAVGNVVGSNIFNILAVLGLSSILAPSVIGVSEAAVNFDIPVMTAVAIACLPVLSTGRIVRWQGVLFLCYYVAYVAYLILDASEHDAVGAYSAVMLFFVLPISGTALIATFLWEMRKRFVGGRSSASA